MPLTEPITFKTRLQIGNGVQIPKYVRWHYKLEPTQIIEVTVSILGLWRPAQSFMSRIGKDGRMVISKLALRYSDVVETSEGIFFKLKKSIWDMVGAYSEFATQKK